MSKLFKLREWITIPDAAKRLTVSLGEAVTEVDVFRLSLDGHLALSVQLVNAAYGRLCKRMNLNEIEWMEVAPLVGDTPIRIPKNGRVWCEEGVYFQVTPDVVKLECGIWDLPMSGGERVDVEHEYQSLTSGPAVTAVTLEGVFMQHPNGDLFEIQEHFADNDQFDAKKLHKPFTNSKNFHPAGMLPDDVVYVVRTSALTNFEASLIASETKPDQPLTTRERNNLLTIIAALCKEAKLDHKKPSKTAALILGVMAEMGVHVGESTIEGHLKKIPDALVSRAK